MSSYQILAETSRTMSITLQLNPIDTSRCPHPGRFLFECHIFLLTYISESLVSSCGLRFGRIFARMIGWLVGSFAVRIFSDWFTKWRCITARLMFRELFSTAFGSGRLISEYFFSDSFLSAQGISGYFIFGSLSIGKIYHYHISEKQVIKSDQCNT